jgi:hypothetical protein
MLHTLTDPQAELIRNHLVTLAARTKTLLVSHPDESLCTRLSVDAELLLALWDTLCEDTAEPAEADDLVDVIKELQGRLPQGAALTIQIPPLRHDRG